MAAWDPAQYLQFERERTQPCRDLVARLEGGPYRRIVDLGCGPGTSTAVLRARWPDAAVTGIDRSAAMLERARASDPAVTWLEDDLGRWTPEGPFDLVFSNAALQWLPDHGTLFPRLFDAVAPGGALAVQMPANDGAPYLRAVARLRARPEWRPYRPEAGSEIGIESAEFYYDLLAPRARRVDLWDTRYVHDLAGPDAIVAWTTGTGLRPWLAALPDEAHRQRFLGQYRAAIARLYPPTADGKVLFPFVRRFVVAYRDAARPAP